jgi:small subunit ribosomal protein S19
MVRETYLGKNEEEWKNASLEEFLKLTNSRARRTLKRGRYAPLVKNIAIAKKQLTEGKIPKPIRTHRRDTILTPDMLGLTFSVYNGKQFIDVEVTVEKLGHYLGEFALTRRFVTHGKAGVGATKGSKVEQKT